MKLVLALFLLIPSSLQAFCVYNPVGWVYEIRKESECPEGTEHKQLTPDGSGNEYMYYCFQYYSDYEKFMEHFCRLGNVIERY